jgi:endogenous inhibitor of DNA gyrase (YacG/DUF329 family)
MSVLSVQCPTCRKPVIWGDSPFRPFCSERCQTIDLGQWASESYRLPTDERAAMSADEEEPNQ